MNELLGEEITAIVTDKNDKNVYVQKNGVTYEMTNDDSYEIGDTVQGFVYQNKAGRNKMTLKLPTVTKENFGWGIVEDVRRDLGVFVNIGLPDKDLAVSLDLLPNERELWPKKGDRLYLQMEQDKEGRLWGVLAEEDLFLDKKVPGSEESHNQSIEGTVFAPKITGTLFLTEDNRVGFIHPSQREREPRLGEHVTGRVIGLREDGVVYTSLLPRAHEVLEEDAAMILEVLKRSPEQKIPLTDKSKPEEIKKQFGISKGQFKRSVGRLMKKGLVKQEDGFTYYLGEQDKE